MSRESSAVDALVRLMGDKPIAFHPLYAEVLGSIGAAVYIQQLLYWHEKSTLVEDGFIKKTCAEFRAETTLTEKQQRNIRTHLLKLGLIEIKRIGMPAMPCYRVDHGAFIELISAYRDGGADAGSDDEDEAESEDDTNENGVDSPDTPKGTNLIAPQDRYAQRDKLDTPKGPSMLRPSKGSLDTPKGPLLSHRVLTENTYREEDQNAAAPPAASSVQNKTPPDPEPEPKVTQTHNELFDAVSDVLKFNPVALGGRIGTICKDLRKMNATPEQVYQVEEYWNTQDWRGRDKKDQLTQKLLFEIWDAALKPRPSGKSSAGTPQTNNSRYFNPPAGSKIRAQAPEISEEERKHKNAEARVRIEERRNRKDAEAAANLARQGSNISGGKL